MTSDSRHSKHITDGRGPKAAFPGIYGRAERLVGGGKCVYGHNPLNLPRTRLRGRRHEQDAAGETNSQPDHRLPRRSLQRPSSPYSSGCSTLGRGSSAVSS